jgi:hypothetical protein
MASTYSNSLVLELMETGSNANTWGNNTNTNLQTVDAFTAGYLSKSVAGSANVTLTTSATTDPTVESANKVLDLNGTLTGNITVFVPQKENNYLIYNNTSGSFTLDIAATGGSGVEITQGSYEWVYCDGTDIKIANVGYETTNASLLSSGTLADARLSSNVTLNNASTISTGTLADARLTANVTLNNASTISTGTLDIARLGTTADPQFNSIGVGTTASATTGQIRATDDITAFYSSDVALKENIHNIPSASEKIEQLNGVLFDWKQEWIDNNGGEDGYFVRKSDVGVIAQDVEKVLPEIVGTRPNGIKAVKYDRLCALLIEGFKEMKQEIKQLKESK